MTPLLYVQLVLLGAIWGTSFLFMRILAPNIGALVTAEARVLLGGLGLAVWFAATGFDAQWRRFWKPYLVTGLINTALPFSLFAYAALTIPASYSAILNSVAPLWGALFAAIWLDDRFTWRKFAGLLLGSAGVALIARVGPVPMSMDVLIAIGAAIVGTAFYGVASVYIKLHLASAKPAAVAGGSQLLAGLLFVPILFTGPADASFTASVFIYIAIAGLVCGSVAYLLYYRILALAGPMHALSVTYLVPLFGMAWGALFLDEAITPGMLAGCVLVMAGLTLLAGATQPKPAPEQP